MVEAQGPMLAPGVGEGALAEPIAGPEPTSAGARCPFLASIDLEDRVGTAHPRPDTANRCLSTGEPFPPSIHDQRALCLTADHSTCLRFIQATQADEEVPASSVARLGRRIPGPIVAALGILVLATALAAASLAAKGDLSAGVTPVTSPAMSPGGPRAAAVTTAPAASASDAAALPVPPPTAASAAPVPTATGAPAVSPSPTAGVEAVTSAPSPRATTHRSATPTVNPRLLRGLTPCPDRMDCYVYVVKRGDTLYSIAFRYGLTQDAVLALNPTIRDRALVVVGQEVRIPTPRR